MLKFKLNTNRQTFNNNIATAEKSPMLKSHKSLYEHVSHKLTSEL